MVRVNKDMDYEKYINSDNTTYTSPKNGKVYKSKKAFIAHISNKGTGGWKAVNQKKSECKHCEQKFSLGNIRQHEASCYMNPNNIKLCEVCNNPIKDYKHTKGTCSHSCSNVKFKNVRNKDERLGYRALCFRYHEMKCVVCNEHKIVAVHHYNENHNDNDPANLIPLCPTHHQYVHSKYKDEVQPIIDEYIENWKSKPPSSSVW